MIPTVEAQLETAIAHEGRLPAILAVHPSVRAILRTAALYHDAATRWQMYSLLKTRIPCAVPPDEYQIVARAIDLLLPEELEGEIRK